MSKKICFIWLGILFFLFPSAVANSSSPPGWYTSLHTGITTIDKSSTTINTNTNYGVNIDFGKGFNIGAAVGYKLYNSIRFEEEFTYRNNNINNVLHSNGNMSTAGEFAQISLMTNVLYDLDFFPFFDVNLTPYFGGGVGFTGTDLDDYVGPNANISLLMDNDDVSFAGQLIIGFSYELLDSTHLTFDYRHFFASNSDFKDLSGKFELENTNNNFIFGIRHHFW